MKKHIYLVVFSFLAMLMGPYYTVSATGMASEADDALMRQNVIVTEMRLDAEECRVLAEAGTILSMMELMDRVKALTDGHMLDTALIKQGEDYIYEMEVAGRDGVVRMLLVDARTGSMIKE